jgi:alpha-glucan,water dikinase
MILKKIDPHIRKCAHLGDWLVISQGRSHGSRGYVEKVKHLQEVMHHNYERRTILLCDKVEGDEEVPNNVQAIVLVDGTDYPDVLAHVSVRARNLKVMFTVCFSDQAINELKSLEGRHCFMTINNHNVRF